MPRLTLSGWSLAFSLKVGTRCTQLNGVTIDSNSVSSATSGTLDCR